MRKVDQEKSRSDAVRRIQKSIRGRRKTLSEISEHTAGIRQTEGQLLRNPDGTLRDFLEKRLRLFREKLSHVSRKMRHPLHFQ